MRTIVDFLRLWGVRRFQAREQHLGGGSSSSAAAAAAAARSWASRAPRQLLQALAYSAGTTFIYETWRARELQGIRRDCLALVRDGLVELESPVSAAQKQSAWERNLLPA